MKEAMLNPVYYVLGFAFSDEKLVLIQKNHPADQAGKLNGVGGKIQDGESAWEAMVREYAEETSVLTPIGAWSNVGRMIGVDGQGVGFHVEVFVTDDHDAVENARTVESEPIRKFDWQQLLQQSYGQREHRMMDNIPALIALCRLNMSGHGPTFALTYE